MITKRRFIVDLLDNDNNNETEQFIRKYGADEITGMTNGDVIKALFPNLKHTRIITNGVYECHIDHKRHSFDYSWWNAPYRRE